jgi:hypothetical protein
MVKAALYPPTCPTLIKKSRLLKPISEPFSSLNEHPCLAKLSDPDQQLRAE